MYNEPSASPNEPSPESDRLKTLLDNLNNLRGKLKNFTVIDELGQPIGEISDLILDAGHQLNLVIAQPDTQGQPSVLLNGRRIKKVSVQTESVFVDITRADVPFLPEYLLSDIETEPPRVTELPSTATTQAASIPIAPPLPIPTPPPDFSLDVMEPITDESVVLPDATIDSTNLFEQLDQQELAASRGGRYIDPNLLDLEQPSAIETNIAPLELPNEAHPLDEFALDDLSSQADEVDINSLDVPELDLSLDVASDVNPPRFLDEETDDPLREAFVLDDLGLGEQTDDLVVDEQVSDSGAFDSLELPDLNFDDTPDFDRQRTGTVESEWAEVDRVFGVDPSETTSSPDSLNLDLLENDRIDDLPDLTQASVEHPSNNPPLELPDTFSAPTDLPNLDFELDDRSAQPDLELLDSLELSPPVTNQLDDLDLGFGAAPQSDALLTSSDPEPLNFGVAADPPPAESAGLPDFDFAAESGDFAIELPELNLDQPDQPDLTIPQVDQSLDQLESSPLGTEPLNFELDDLGLGATPPPIEPVEATPLATETIERLTDLDFPSNEDDLPDFSNLDAIDQSVEPASFDALELELPATDSDPIALGSFDDAPELELPVSNLDSIALGSFEDAPAEVAAPAPLNLDDLDLSPPTPVPPTTPPLEATHETSTFDLDGVPAQTYEVPSTSDAISTDLDGVSAQTYEVPSTSDAVFISEPDAIVPLLEERLKVEYERRKVGEVVVRKKIETRIVQVPVRYEKLVIEQVGSEGKPLAEIDLSQGLLDSLTEEVRPLTTTSDKPVDKPVDKPIDKQTDGSVDKPSVSAQFRSAKTASHVLDAIAKTLSHRCKGVRIEIELEDSQLQQAYQDWLDQCSRL